MIYILIGIILFLLIIIYQQFRAKRMYNENLRYLSEKITTIQANHSSERILLRTDDMQLRELLVEINRLLDYHQSYIADNYRIKMSMNRMLSNISHDLKTPLTVILGYIETIQHDKHDSSQERDALLEKVHGKVIELASLINKFFDLAKLESGDWKLAMDQIHINETCRKVMIGYYDILTSKGFEVILEIPKEPFYIKADLSSLERVLNNLLSNAIKYGKDGKEIGLALYQKDNSVCIDIWDSGKGIHPTEYHQIFERLYRAGDARNSSVEGSGLGLTIAKRLVDQMNGEIKFSSTPYHQTTFTLIFPKI
ncbi:sensor histidine kinase [Gracilibacillus massiliensis]|uniref:sensor histidine kinase n=1 Tax=Gracilibacillus massiliensis TaxID=1564956 RepID=UPI00071DA5A0|nr:HAMP domain-containing sensor histidine kinase [Gracilibacillus massiliensis]